MSFAASEYYVYEKKLSEKVFPGDPSGDIPTVKVLDPIYLLEGKHVDDNDPRNYSLEISVNNIRRTHYFPELATLPRNTHVVVNITCDVDTKITCKVDVIPYSEITLDPGFGLPTTI